jgi:hypothetical protein
MLGTIGARHTFLLLLSFPFAVGLGFSSSGCAQDDSSCSIGSFGCACFSGNICLPGLSCFSGVCVAFGGDGETGETGDGDTGDGDTGPGDGDGDTGPGDGDGDGDAGDGDGDSGPGDGDGDTGGDPCDAGVPVVLHDQTETEMATGIFSNTLIDYDNATVQVADDFVIPQNQSCWCITEITAKGFYRDGITPANVPSVNVEIFADGNAVPTGSPIYSAALSPDDDDATYTLTLPNEVLAAGTYWLSVHPTLEFAETSWQWFLASTLNGDPIASRDSEGLAFDGNCTDWTPTSECLDAPPPDPWEFTLQFEIVGVVGGSACN